MDRFKEVEEILEKVRPALKEHHGNLRVVDIRDGDVYLQFEGGCTDCPIVDASLKEVIALTIKGNLHWVKNVEVVQPKYQIG
ncbi:NifU family protein [Thermocrinis minervae]|uniref:Fe-S cluster biogenesis protein NfuA, 4Fe-4S-binding domain n=1 Tax=Thermocrinis minervae TaxID=381751 RepID=A0A1M6QZ62_9AQUI|nr:NifU family protein [Thermocrinis minervae]SHK25521.1 Fe-S cluster biogenesis protein NfuA, 4Fe-4S-binding domain [Thermocrinis minervae]